MWLTNKTKSDLVYCLVNTPKEIMEAEFVMYQRMNYEIGENEQTIEKFKLNYIYDDIAPRLRMKSYPIELPKEDVEAVKERVVMAREYLSKMSL